MSNSPFAQSYAQLSEQGCPVIPLQPNEKRPHASLGNWARFIETPPTDEQLEHWAGNLAGAGIGMLMGSPSGLLGIDVDTDDKSELAAINSVLPPSPIKKRGGRGFTAFYRLNGEQSRKIGCIDILATGRQCALPPSSHPTSEAGYQYTTPDTLEDYDLKSLSMMTAHDWSKLEAVMVQLGYVVGEPASGQALGAVLPDMEATPDELTDLKAALGRIPADTYDQWTNVGNALRCLGDVGLELWLEWSATSDKYNDQEARKKWRSFHHKENGTTYESVFKWARDAGWEAPERGSELAAQLMAGMNAKAANSTSKENEAFSFEAFAITETADEMEARMEADVFVVDGLAIKGQWTMIYGRPNSGKTLLTLALICKQIDAGDIDGSRVFYVNADDHPRGIMQKNRIAQKYGFKMLVPGHNGFRTDMLLLLMRKAIESQTAGSYTIILDTVKKFTDLMSKRLSTEFGRVVREFISVSGTVIGLGHTNKRKDEAGNDIYAGTSDLVDDADCAFMLGILEDEESSKIVEFQNFKARGDVRRVATYRYITGAGVSYQSMFDSVTAVGETGRREAEQRNTVANTLAKNNDCIVLIKKLISEGTCIKTELVEAAQKQGGHSRAHVVAVLEQHEGDNLLSGHRWTCTRGLKNRQEFALLGVGGKKLEN